ncbi:Chromatin assembly factor 1 complex p150 subunit N-terminal [Aspergillus parasiticus SU-1]|uniref:Chromatin assembly factor 1 complex p150 subunit N-terminal n=1 Tax=Aspergillus parasiticus (strain ATCC 56775 / NRRL 5862 / SRRC 143 / SU-1) TaxID=1403190 RepID=A0A0F0I5Z8_ASPPU|nr:Chromatin assembly factor 1 complex p150 subunit N-terminal [Aspergillus parasiticus SU-1]
MVGEIAKLRRQLVEAQRLREEANQRQKKAEQRLREAELRQKKPDLRQIEKELQQKKPEIRQRVTERQAELNSLSGLLNSCHKLSQAICVQTNVTLTAENTTSPVNRLFPKRIRHWNEFPEVQEKIWDRLNRDRTLTRKRRFRNNNFLDEIHKYTWRHTIFSEASLYDFQRDTMERFVNDILDALLQDHTLRREFRLEGRRRNRGADQFCVHVASDERRIPAYAVEFKAPHKLRIPDLIAGLHDMEPERDVIDKKGDTFEFHATHLVAAAITQLFSYMVDSGVRNGYICTGEAYVFLHIDDDPTVVYYYLCVPNRDVNPKDKYHLHRTAVAQVLAFTLNALAAEPPSQDWFDAARKNLSTWKVEYLNVLKNIPEKIRKDPPSFEYKPSCWKPVERSPYHTRSQGRCQPNQKTCQGSSESNFANEGYLPSAPATRGQNNLAGSNRGSNTRKYCTMACLRGLLTRGRLDPQCPNVHQHGPERHQINSRDFTRRLHAQLRHDRHKGFEQLHIRGRTGFLLKATLLSHGYTVIIKATTEARQHNLRKEIDAYRSLQQLQGHSIPVHVGSFQPRIPYWYHGERMSYMMILSWSGVRMETLLMQNNANASLFSRERNKLRKILRSHGIVHGDLEYRNILWNDSLGHAIVIDFEDVTWVENRQPLGSTSGNVARRHASDKRGNLHGYNTRLSPPSLQLNASDDYSMGKSLNMRGGNQKPLNISLK